MSKTFRHKCNGTCSAFIDITYNEEHIIENVVFYGGCPGNTKGVAALSKGRKLEEIHDICKGILCGNKNTSCPNELALGIEEILNENN